VGRRRSRSLGHERVGHAAAESPKATYRRRADSLSTELARTGIRFDPAWRFRSTFDIDQATQRAVEFLQRSDVTAVFCDDDLLAGGVYRACRKLRIRIPDDLSVVGFDDIDLSRLLEPELTTVAIPAEDIGRKAVEALLRRVSGKTRQTRSVLTLTLVVRNSTARPTARVGRETRRGHGSS
jgi:LacI family transcriptional regulator/LacI family repressor for deo operon, udp, cdd, tsx, nupC, and nupG